MTSASATCNPTILCPTSRLSQRTSIPKIQAMYPSHLLFLSIDRKCFFFLSSLSLICHTLHLHLHTTQSAFCHERILSASTLRFFRNLPILPCCDHLDHASHVPSSHISALISESCIPCFSTETPGSSQPARSQKTRRIFCCGR